MVRRVKHYATFDVRNPLFSSSQNVNKDNFKQNKKFYETLEIPVFSRVFFMFVFPQIVVKTAEF